MYICTINSTLILRIYIKIVKNTLSVTKLGFLLNLYKIKNQNMVLFRILSSIYYNEKI